MSMHPREFDAWHRAEADVERLKAQLRALGEEVPEAAFHSTNPRMDAEGYARLLRHEIRLVLLRRHAEAMRADLASVVSLALLDDLDAAQVHDEYRIDGILPLGLARRLRDLLREREAMAQT